MVRDPIKILKEKIDENVFVSVDSGNIRYLSNPEFGDAIASAILISKSEEVALVSSLEKNRALDVLNLSVKTYSPLPKMSSDARNLVSVIKKLANGKEIISDRRIKGLRTKVNDPVKELREVKDENEIEKIRKANRITKSVNLDEIIEKGRNEIEIARDVEDSMIKGGATGFAFPTIVACNKHTAYSHHEPAKEKFKYCAMVDFGASYKGYCADVTRTLILENRRLEKIKEMVEESIPEVVESFGEGSRCSDIDRAFRGEFKSYKKYFYHNTGHGLGVEVHESPLLKINSKDTLKKGSVFAIEPGIYIKGLGGIRIEDDFYIDGNGKIKRICE